MTPGKVLGRSTSDNQQIETFDDNPMMNSIIYDVEFPDGVVKEYPANFIAENIYQNVDINRSEELSLYCIIDHSKSEDDVSKDDRYVITKNGNRRLRRNNIVWEVLVRWKNRTNQWGSLSIMKYNCPVQMAEYAQA